MPERFLHGVEVIEVESGTRPIQTVSTAVIGLVGTASKGPINKPVVIAGSRREVREMFGSGLGTIPKAVDAIFDQAGATLVVVNVLNPATHKAAVAEKDYALEGDSVSLDHIYASNLVVQNKTDPNNIVTYVEGTDYEYAPETGVLSRIEGGGIAADATVAVTYDQIDESAVTEAVLIGSSGDDTGVWALPLSEPQGKIQPKILIAPGYTSKVSKTGGSIDGAPVTTALASVADRLRAIVVADGPNTTDAEAITYRELFGSRRVFVVDPAVKILDSEGNETSEGASARVAGVIAKSDQERGFWWSPSNREIAGVLGTGRAVDFSLGDVSARANHLNENEVATVIGLNGWRLWGNRTCSDDPKWAFLSVVRTADAINESLLRAHLWAVDRNITKTYLEDVAEGVNAYLRRLVGLGAILGGSCWPDPTLNSKAVIAAGKVYFNFDFTPPYPAEQITFRSALVEDYLQDLV